MITGDSKFAQTLPEHNSDHLSSANDNVIHLRTARLLAPRGLPRTDAAFYIGCSPRMFDGMVKKGEMPSPRLIGKKRSGTEMNWTNFLPIYHVPVPTVTRMIGMRADEGGH